LRVFEARVHVPLSAGRKTRVRRVADGGPIRRALIGAWNLARTCGTRCTTWASYVSAPFEAGVSIVIAACLKSLTGCGALWCVAWIAIIGARGNAEPALAAETAWTWDAAGAV